MVDLTGLEPAAFPVRGGRSSEAELEAHGG